MQKRNIILSIVLTIVTCGLYGFYWMYQVTEEVYRQTGERVTASGGKAVLYTFITCSVYFYYWLYKTSGAVGDLREARGLSQDAVAKENYIVTGIVVFLLSLAFDVLRVLLATFVVAFADEMSEEDLANGISVGFQGLAGMFFSLVLLGAYIWLVYRHKKDESPRLLTMVTGIMFAYDIYMPLLMLGFVQKALNDLADLPEEKNLKEMS